MRYLVVVPISPRSTINIVLESQPTKALAEEAAKRRRDNADPDSIHRLASVKKG